MEIKITLDQLRSLLNQQKALVVERLRSSSSYYNKESTEGHCKSLPIDEGKFEEQGLSSKYPEDFNTLVKYLK